MNREIDGCCTPPVISTSYWNILESIINHKVHQALWAITETDILLVGLLLVLGVELENGACAATLNQGPSYFPNDLPFLLPFPTVTDGSIEAKISVIVPDGSIEGARSEGHSTAQISQHQILRGIFVVLSIEEVSHFVLGQREQLERSLRHFTLDLDDVRAKSILGGLGLVVELKFIRIKH
uniref:Uncharacterized protein n=1 Tax=Pristionchus pacificus TaxID=54126 RepID=A0A2A6BBK0_PRIPA|eukprot:PDM63250.1 hypothetical protein PRIPAC_50465 [Pristionchus pacificus]